MGPGHDDVPLHELAGLPDWGLLRGALGSPPTSASQTWEGKVEVERAILGTEDAGESSTRRAVASSVAAAWAATSSMGRAAAVLSAVLSLGVAVVWLNDAPVAAAVGLCVVVLTSAALVDAAERRLPNLLVGLAAVPVFVGSWLALILGESDVAVGALGGAALLGVPLLLTHLASPTGMGFGDVKAGAVLGAALGSISTEIAVLALLVTLGGSAGWAIANGRRSVALGPGLVGGALAALAISKLMGIEAN